MRKLLGSCCLVLLSASSAACSSQGNQAQDGMDRPQVFQTQDEAVAKARADFLEVLQSDVAANLGVDAATLERARAGHDVRRVDVAFDRLLRADSTTTFPELIAAERNVVVPLILEAEVATIVEVARAERGWRVVGLAGRDIADDLSAVFAATGDVSDANLTLYEIPNLQARVYGVMREGTETLFTDYGDRFSIRQGVGAAELLSVLQPDAVEFQRVYGDSASENRLLR